MAALHKAMESWIRQGRRYVSPEKKYVGWPHRHFLMEADAPLGVKSKIRG